MKNYTNETIFESTKGPKARADYFFFIFVESCPSFDAIHNFLVWLRTGSNPADSNPSVSKPYWKIIYKQVKNFKINAALRDLYIIPVYLDSLD